MAENSRRIERERVLSLLYEAEIKGETVEEVLAQLPVPPADFVIETVRGVDGVRNELDVEIEQYAANWDVERIAAVDRNILRIGLWELHYRPEVSLAVAISEAVELAKRFSTDGSGRFVNGVLAAAGDDLRG